MNTNTVHWNMKVASIWYKI